MSSREETLRIMNRELLAAAKEVLFAYDLKLNAVMPQKIEALRDAARQVVIVDD